MPSVAPESRSLAGLVATAWLVGTTPALAAEPAPWSFTLNSATEYISKGVGESDGDPHLSAGIEHSLGRSVYAGAWAATAKTSQGSDAEAHLYLGARPRLGETRLDLRAFYKTNPGAGPGVQEGLLELRGDLSRPVGATRVRLRTEYSPDSYARTRQAWWFEAQASRPLTERISVSGAYGVREQEGGVDYNAWNFGAALELTEGFAVELRWFDTSAHGRGDQYDGRAVASASFRF